MFYEVWMVAEIIRLAMLKDEESIGLDKVASHDDIGEFGQVRQLVGRIGKDYVELLIATCQVLEDIATYGNARLVAQLLKEALDKTVVQTVLLYADNLRTASREKLERDATGTRKEVECRGLLVPVNVAIEDIEKILLGKVCSRTCLKRTRHVKVPPFIFTCNYSHG